jgi:phenylacetate-CoA ligase
MTEPDYDRQRLAHSQFLNDGYPLASQALDWSREQISRHQTERLRWLMQEAMQSPFWQERLHGVDRDGFDVAHLRDLPTLTKREMMDNWSDLITLRGVSKDEAYRFLDGLSEDRYFHDEYHLVASGGSSGEPALFLYDWAGWAGCAVPMGRYSTRMASQYPALKRDPGVSANVGAGRASHMTFALSSTFAPASAAPNLIPVSLPLRDIVDKLNALQPVRISGYPSMLLLLTEEARAGRLNIQPHTVQPSSEPLTLATRAAIEEVWNPIIINIWGCSEACCVANSYARDSGMYVNEDFAIVEPVDADNNPVVPGVVSEKVLITNLFNAAQPLIRYELTDQVTVIPEESPSGIPFFRIEDIQGRSDDVLRYGDTMVHPILFRGPLARTPDVLEFQVFQTVDGASVHYLASDAVDEALLAQTLERALARAGVQSPSVTMHRQDKLMRVGVGKLKRFFPL